MKTLHVSVADKIATYRSRDGLIVCGNKDYQIEFAFDEEWDAHTVKTARFVWGGQYFDQDFTGTVCPVPLITNTDQVMVGVYAGDLSTTTPAEIGCLRSILCGPTTERPESGQNYVAEAQEAAQEALLAKAEAQEAAARAEGLLIEHDAEEQLYRKQTAQTISFIEQDIQDILEGGTGGGSGARGMKAFTVENFLTLHVCVSDHETVEMNGEAVTPAVFSHGDVFRVREEGVPDFWFEDKASIYDESELDQHEHTYTYNGEVYDMTVYGLQGLEVLGYLHPVKSVGGKVSPLAGKQYTVAAVDKDGNLTSLAVDSGTYIGAIPLRESGGRIRVGPPANNWHTVNLGYLNERLSPLEERIVALEGIDDGSQYIPVESDADGIIPVPVDAMQYAQLSELRGAHFSYYWGMDGYFQPNYPTRVYTGDGRTLFTVSPEQVEAAADFADIGLAGNYIHFADGKVLYTRTVRHCTYDETFEELAPGEVELENTGGGCHETIVQLASPITVDVTDVLVALGAFPDDYCTTGGIIDIGDEQQIFVNYKYSAAQHDDFIDEDNGYMENSGYKVPTAKIIFET